MAFYLWYPLILDNCYNDLQKDQRNQPPLILANNKLNLDINKTKFLKCTVKTDYSTTHF